MRLADKYGHARVETACQRALGFDLINVQRVERILKNAIAPSGEPPQSGEFVSMPLRFLRPNESFSHEPKRKEEYRWRRRCCTARSKSLTSLCWS